MFRKSRASSSPATSPTSPSSGGAGGTESNSNNEISDSYEVVETPSGSGANSLPSTDARATSGGKRRPSPPPPRVRQASSRDDWYPSWLPRRPPPPAPASTVPSERGHANSPVPYTSPPSNAGTSRGPSGSAAARPMAPGAHGMTPSFGTGFTGYTGDDGVGIESGEYVDIGEYEFDPALAESEGTEAEGGRGGSERVGIGRRQTPRSVRIISDVAAASSRRHGGSSRHSRRASTGATATQQVRSRKEGGGGGTGGQQQRVGHVHGSGPKPWWRGTVSTPLSPTVVAPSPGPGALGPTATGGGATEPPPPRALMPAHMRAYLPHPGMSIGPAFGPSASGEGGGALPTRPRFRAPGLDLGFLAPPSAWKRLQFVLWPVWVYGIVVLQSYLDLNAIYTLVQLALHPTPAAPPSASSNNSNPSSSRNWALGASAYGVCWLFWIVGVVILYEIVYSWWRRWRCKRPLMIPLYLSAPAFNLVCMTSYVNFCFFRYIRSSARPRLPVIRFLRACGCGSSSSGSTIPSRAVTPSVMSTGGDPRESQQHERGELLPSPATNGEGKENVGPGSIMPTPASIRNPLTSFDPIMTMPMTMTMSSLGSWGDWFAETCFFYGQNLPTVALLVPRAALSIAILLAYTSAPPEDKALEALGLMKRDQTFFRPDGSLSGYARGVLLTNVAWAGWRVLILFISWLGLWWMSGQLCAGVCGPRFRWEEPEEKPGYQYQRGFADEEQFEDARGVLATWGWRACTRIRIYDAYDLCLFLPPAPVPVPSAPIHPVPASSRKAGKAREVASSVGEKPVMRRVGGEMDEEEENAVLDRVLAAAGLPTVPPPARRGVLREELFNTPPELRRELTTDDGTVSGTGEGEVREITVSSPKPPGTREGSRSRSSKSKSSREREREHVPPNLMPYPFTAYPARQGSQDTGLPSSQEKIPFPPSPRTSKHSDREGSASSSAQKGGEVEVEGEEGKEEEEEEEDYDNEEGYDEFGLSIAEPSSGRNSESISSLGQQIPSRFPFQFRHISRRSRGGRSSAGTHQSRSTSNKTSSASYGASVSASHTSRTASSSDRRESQKSQSDDSPWSQGQRSQSQRSTSVRESSSIAQSRSRQSQSQSFSQSRSQSSISPRDVGTTESSSYGSPISGHLAGPSPFPMPPARATHANRRQRVSLPTVPVSAIPAAFTRVRDRSRTLSGSTQQGSPGLNLTPHPPHESVSDGEEEHEVGVGSSGQAGAGATAAEFGMLPDPEADGSQEEAEREDSVGLLSGGPSPHVEI